MIQKTSGLLKNQLLAALPPDLLDVWSKKLEPVDMPLGLVMYEAGTQLCDVYFPITSVVSLLYVMKNGESAEIAVVGNDGLVGVSLFMGGGSTPSRALVQNGGQGFRMDADLVKQAFETSVPVMRLLLRYTQALITQMTQTAACNKHHSLNQQLCRWVLLTVDRCQENELVMTKQMIANMLGTSGKTMRQGAAELEDEGLIRYSHGKITILNRTGLEKRSCECYAVVKEEYERLLPQSERQRPS